MSNMECGDIPEDPKEKNFASNYKKEAKSNNVVLNQNVQQQPVEIVNQLNKVIIQGVVKNDVIDEKNQSYIQNEEKIQDQKQFQAQKKPSSKEQLENPLPQTNKPEVNQQTQEIKQDKVILQQNVDQPLLQPVQQQQQQQQQQEIQIKQLNSQDEQTKRPREQQVQVNNDQDKASQDSQSEMSMESKESVTQNERCYQFIPSVIIFGLWGFDILFNIHYFFFQNWQQNYLKYSFLAVFFFFFFLLLLFSLFGIPRKLDYAIPTRFFFFVLTASNLVELRPFRLMVKQFNNTESWMRVRINKFQIYLYFSFFPTCFIRIINDEFRSENWHVLIIIGGAIKLALGIYSLYYIAYVRTKFIDWFYKSIIYSLLLAQCIFFLLIMCIVYGFHQYNQSLDYYAQYIISSNSLTNISSSQYVDNLKDKYNIYFDVIKVFKYTPCVYCLILIIFCCQYLFTKCTSKNKQFLKKSYKMTVYQSAFVFALSAIIFLVCGVMWLVCESDFQNEQNDEIKAFFKIYDISFSDLKKCQSKSNHNYNDMCNFSIDFVVISNMIKSMLLNLSILCILIFHYICIRKVIQEKAYVEELKRLEKKLRIGIYKNQ